MADRGGSIRRWMRTDLDAARAALLAERARLAGGGRRGDRRARPDDLRLAGRGGQPGLRAAARPRPARPVDRPARARRGRASRGSTTGRSGRASAAASRSPRHGSRRCRGPRTASTASAIVDRRAPADRRRAARHASTTSGPRPPTPARRRRPDPARRRSGRPADRRVPQGRVAPADRRLQDPRRVPRSSRRCRRPSGPAASSRTRRATTPRASRGRPGCSASRPSWSCRPTPRRIKRERVEADGAEVVVGRHRPATSDSASPSELAAERGLTVIPPFDDDRIIAGQGTIGLELVEDLPDLAAVLVPIGGGGLASGVATAVKALRPSARVIGVEPELAADAARLAGRAARSSLAGRATCRGRSPTGRAPRRIGAPDVRPPARAPRRRS